MASGLVLGLQKNAVSPFFAKCSGVDPVDIFHAGSSRLFLGGEVLSLLQNHRVSVPIERDLSLRQGGEIVLGDDKGTLRLRTDGAYHLQRILVQRDIVERAESVDTQVSPDDRPVPCEVAGCPGKHADPVRRPLPGQTRQYYPAYQSCASALHGPASRCQVIPRCAERARRHIYLFTAKDRRDLRSISPHLLYCTPVKIQFWSSPINNERFFNKRDCRVPRQVHAQAEEGPLPVLRKGDLRLINRNSPYGPVVPHFRYSAERSCEGQYFDIAVVEGQVCDADDRAPCPVVIVSVPRVCVVPHHFDKRRRPVDREFLGCFAGIAYRCRVSQGVCPGHLQRIDPVQGESQFHGPRLRVARSSPLPFPRHGSRCVHLQLFRIKIPLTHSHRSSPCPVKISPVLHLIVVKTDLYLRSCRVNSKLTDPPFSGIRQIPRVVACGNRYFEVVTVPLPAGRDRDLAVKSVNEILTCLAG